MAQTTSFTLNGKAVRVTADPGRMLVWVLRHNLGLTGTKVGCGAGLCGACTVLANGEPIFSCSTPLADVAGTPVLQRGTEHSIQVDPMVLVKAVVLRGDDGLGKLEWKIWNGVAVLKEDAAEDVVIPVVNDAGGFHLRELREIEAGGPCAVKVPEMEIVAVAGNGGREDENEQDDEPGAPVKRLPPGHIRRIGIVGVLSHVEEWDIYHQMGGAQTCFVGEVGTHMAGGWWGLGVTLGGGIGMVPGCWSLTKSIRSRRLSPGAAG